MELLMLRVIYGFFIYVLTVDGNLFAWIEFLGRNASFLFIAFSAYDKDQMTLATFVIQAFLIVTIGITVIVSFIDVPSHILIAKFLAFFVVSIAVVCDQKFPRERYRFRPLVEM